VTTATMVLTRRGLARAIASALLVFIGAAPVCIALVDYRWGFAGAITGASPLPLVFDAAVGYEPWACRYEISITYEDGAREKLEVDPAVLARMRGPHWPHVVHAVYALPLALSPVMGRGVWGPPLRSAVCRDGDFLRALGAKGSARSVTIHITTKSAHDRRSWQIPYRC
jgi:hypothetical protein